MQSDLKILIIGPSKSGKSEIANIISGQASEFQNNYKPTVALRILEYQAQIDNKGLPANIGVQIWDTSGDEKYQPTWPALAKNADGVFVVYNAFDKAQASEVEIFVKALAGGLDPSQVCVLANKIGTSEAKASKAKLPRQFEKVKPSLCDAKAKTDQVIDTFSNFLSSCYAKKLQSVEDAERRLVGDSV